MTCIKYNGQYILSTHTLSLISGVVKTYRKFTLDMCIHCVWLSTGKSGAMQAPSKTVFFALVQIELSKFCSCSFNLSQRAWPDQFYPQASLVHFKKYISHCLHVLLCALFSCAQAHTYLLPLLKTLHQLAALGNSSLEGQLDTIRLVRCWWGGCGWGCDRLMPGCCVDCHTWGSSFLLWWSEDVSFATTFSC